MKQTIRTLITLIGIWLLSTANAFALSVIRDAEIEQALKQIAKPILQAAGLSPNSIKVLLINDRKLNAFVVDHRHIFVTSGLVRRMKRPEELQAVLAHEAAHIANGHLTRRAGNARASSRTAAIGLALAAAAAASGAGQAAAGLAIGAQSTAQRVFFAHTRTEEASADQSALRYMARSRIDPEAMNDVLDLFRGQEALQPGRRDPYALTHPLTRDRIRAVKGYVAATKNSAKPASANTVYWFDRMRAKLDGFLGNSRSILRRQDAKGNSEIATLRRAIAHHKTPNPKKAIAEVEKLVRLRPNDAYYHELKGQILLESGNPNAAIKSYSRALSIAGREPLIQAGLGRSYLALKTKSGDQQAIKYLQQARNRDGANPGLLRDVALAHARLGQNGLASIATAERYAMIGRLKDAKIHAKRASGLLPRGSSGWLRAQDILAAGK